MLEATPQTSPPPYETSAAEAQRLIEATLKAEPQLTAFGIGIYGERMKRRERGAAAVAQEFTAERAELRTLVEHVQSCADWIKRQVPIKSFNDRHTSYGYKHMVEEWWDARGHSVYVTNGAFIAAAVGLGWEAKHDGPNALFKFSEDSVKSTRGGN
jgi:hypothetical protein